MLAVSMPNLATSAALVETATKCLATAVGIAVSVFSAQARADWALVIVSRVVNVFDETMNSVSVGIQVARRLDEVGAIDVGDEPKSHVAAAVMPAMLRRPSPAPDRSRRCRC